MAIALFVLSLAVIGYVLFGYPLILRALAAHKARPIRKQLEWRTVSILLPVRNGEPWIRTKLRSILALNYPRELVEVLVVSDGSDDRTDEIAREFAGAGVRLLRIPRSGKAAALNAAMRHATGEILFFTDVRQELDPGALRELVACFGDPEVGAASGELIIRDGRTHAEADLGLYWRYEKWIRKQLSQIDSVPGTTGCIYAMRRVLAAPLPEEALLDDVCLPLGAFFRGYQVVLDERARAYDYPAGLGSEFRRKLRTLAGVYQVIRYYPALLGPSNRMWLHFVSHKLGRLLLPYALVTAAAASFFLPDVLSGAALAAQALFYGLALIDLWLPETWSAKRLSSITRAFVVLMAAAMGAAAVLVLPRRVRWKETRISPARPAS